MEMNFLNKFEKTILLKHDFEMRKLIHGLALDVGSGVNPLMAAHVLCDVVKKCVSRKDRRGRVCSPLLTYGKPFVQCDAHFLPFKDKAFDFVHCSHVLEHLEDPKKAYRELKRVGKSGYIETPTWLQEIFFYSLRAHKWVISKRNNGLYYQKPKRRILLPHTENLIARPRYWNFIYQVLNLIYRFVDENFHIFRNRFYRARANKAMKVTILSNSKGGLFTATMQWAKELARKGCDVNIFFLTKSEEAKRLVSSKHIHLNYFTISSLFPNLRALVDFLIRDHPDIIHINFALFGPLAIFKKYVFKTPFIYTSHGLPEPWLEPSLVYKIAYTFEHYLLRFVAFHSSVVVAVSNYVKEMLKKGYDVDSEVIYHGIDADRFKSKNNTQSKRKLGYSETDFIVLYVGKLHPYKDPITLIKAISEVAKKNANLHLVMIGDGELYPEVEKKISKLNLSNHVRLVRRVDNRTLKTLYDTADMFVLPSVSEAFGMALLEAMASGLPVIASNSGACPEVVGNAGLLFNHGDYTDLAEKIITLSFDKGLSRKLAIAGLKRVKDEFCWKDKINQYWGLYRITIQHLCGEK